MNLDAQDFPATDILADSRKLYLKIKEEK